METTRYSHTREEIGWSRHNVKNSNTSRPQIGGGDGGKAWASVVDLAPAPNLGPTPDGDLQEEEEHGMTQKEAKIHMMSALRLAAEPKYTKPDPDFDVSNAVLASMELGVRSITWDMVKKVLVKDKTYSDLTSWITDQT